MANTAYSGALQRAAHFAFKPPVPGVNPEHEHPSPEPDPFNPVPAQEAGAVAGDVFQPEDVPVHTEMRQDVIDHWGHLQAPVPSNVPRETAGLAATARMLANHSQVLYRPNTYAPYKHAEQGRSISFTDGRMPWQAGETVPDDMAYLVMGKNAYDQTQQPNEVYSADQGRYRLGVGITDFGLYQSFQKIGQDAELRAYTGLTADLSPIEKPTVQDAAPYTPAVSGSSYVTPAFQVPSMFALPTETALTDYEATTGGDYWAGAGGGFLETDGY
jgi:hypothetical protein